MISSASRLAQVAMRCTQKLISASFPVYVVPLAMKLMLRGLAALLKHRRVRMVSYLTRARTAASPSLVATCPSPC
jgi:hypothetical protein